MKPTLQFSWDHVGQIVYVSCIQSDILKLYLSSNQSKRTIILMQDTFCPAMYVGISASEEKTPAL